MSDSVRSPVNTIALSLKTKLYAGNQSLVQPGPYCLLYFDSMRLLGCPVNLADLLISPSFLGAVAKLQKATISFVTSVRPYGKLGSHLTDFHEI